MSSRGGHHHKQVQTPTKYVLSTRTSEASDWLAFNELTNVLSLHLFNLQ